MSDRQLLIEYMPFEFSRGQIVESLKENNGILKVTGVLQRAGQKNQNGRIYPRNILMREAKKYMTLISERRALGELDHPDTAVVNLKNVSHNVTEMRWEGDDLVGTVEVLSTPSGNILKELFKHNIRLGISSRGLGSVKAIHEADGSDAVQVQDDFDLVAFDFVSNPSTHGAFLAPVNEAVGGVTHPVCTKWCRAQDLMREIILEIG